MKQRTLQPKTFQKPLIYRVVFGVMYTKWLVAVMFGFFLLHPAVPVFAADSEVANTPGETEASNEESKASPEPEVTEPEVDEPVTEASPAPLTEEGVAKNKAGEDNVATETATTDDALEAADDTNLPVEPALQTAVEEETEQMPEADSVATDATTTPEVEDVMPVATSTDNDVATSSSETAITPVATEETGTTTEPVSEVTDPVGVVLDEPVVSPGPEEVDETETEADENASSSDKEIIYILNDATSDSNRHTFGVNECVSVGGGSYYCHEANGNEAISTDNEVYAAPDAEGDHEIYLRLDGEVRQITHNNYDDRAPFYDAPVEQIVFHRLVDGRYQIFRYDISTETEVQLSDTRENSMEPTQGDGVTVWQEWVADNWEIAALIEGEIKLLSDSAHNDIAPAVKDGYVMWHTMDASGQKLLSVYEIATGQTSLVSDPEGGQVSNPRFVLVYDTTFNNGDMVTKTYDPETGAIEPISSNPRPHTPVIPDPEPGGEAGAIINLKPTTRDAESESNGLSEGGPEPLEDDEVATSSPATTEPNTAGASTTKSFDIDLTIATSTPLELSEFDLIVEPFSSSSSAQQTDSASTSDSVE